MKEMLMPFLFFTRAAGKNVLEAGVRSSEYYKHWADIF